MNNEMIIEKPFAISMAIDKNFLNQEEKDKLFNLVQKLNYEKNNNLWLSGNQSPLNTFKTLNLAKQQNFLFLIKKIENICNTFSKTLNLNYELKCSNAWINQYSQKDFQEPHSHFQSYFSCVYFLSVPENSGNIFFQNPYKNTNIIKDEISVFIPEENTCIVFPSDISHFVLPGKNKEKRISIAFNLIPSINCYKILFD